MNEINPLRKTIRNRYDTVAARFFMRPVSIRITSLLIRTKIGPSEVTLLGFGLGMLAALLFTYNQYVLSITRELHSIYPRNG